MERLQLEEKCIKTTDFTVLQGLFMAMGCDADLLTTKSLYFKMKKITLEDQLK